MWPLDGGETEEGMALEPGSTALRVLRWSTGFFLE